MRIIELETIQRVLDDGEAVGVMKDALVAQARGECDTPMPMHLGVPAEGGEVHIKASYRRGGPYFAVKVASGFPSNLARGLSVGNGMMLLASAETGEPLALLADQGYLTDLRTAAVAALMSRELGRSDRSLGILGSGIQARLQARLHSRVLELERIVVWGRTPERVETYRRDMTEILPAVEVIAAESPAEVARRARLLVTVTASRAPLLEAGDLQPGTHLAAVGSDSPGKQELDPSVLERAALMLVDSRSQCERLGELQHAPQLAKRAVEAGAYCARPTTVDPDDITICDFTGLGVEDLFIAQHVYEKARQESAHSTPRGGAAGSRQ